MGRGRLQRADAPVDFRHPIVLPRRHHLTCLVVEDFHRRIGHFGAQYVGNLLRERFHVVGRGRTIKYYIRTLCMSCRNRRARLGQQQMAPLPLGRVTPKHQVFHSVGVDFMGPISVGVVKRTSSKRYQSNNFLDPLILGGWRGQQLELEPPSISLDPLQQRIDALLGCQGETN